MVGVVVSVSDSFINSDPIPKLSTHSLLLSMPSHPRTGSVSSKQQFTASLVPAMVPVTDIVPMHLEDLKKPADANNPPLSDDEVRAAREAGLINKTLVNTQFDAFRRMRQSRQYQEVNGQRFAVISWVPTTKGTPDPDNCYGLMRIGGCFATQAEADKHAEALLRKDSTREFLVTYVGLDFPLTTDDFGVLKREEIDFQTKAEDIERQNTRRVEEVEEEKAREIEDAREQLLTDVTRKRTADDLDSYIELCVKQAHSEAERARALEQIEKCNRVVVATQPLLEHISSLHPEYKQEAAKKYEAACSRVGIDAKQSVVAPWLDFERLQQHQVQNASPAPEVVSLNSSSMKVVQQAVIEPVVEESKEEQTETETEHVQDERCPCEDCPGADQF